MAAVFALVFVPGLAAVLFMLGGSQDHLSLSSAFATAMFFALVAGLFTGLVRLAHRWEDEKPTGT
jgi:hypothetical protein